jgi:hypothetical protein
VLYRRGFDVQLSGWENGHRAVGLADQKFDLGAAEDDAMRAVGDELGDDVAVGVARFVADDAASQLIVDHLVHPGSACAVGNENRQVVRG